MSPAHLLSYFSEEIKHGAGNCDNCRSPRQVFDGTIIAQKALSAVIRIQSREGMNNVINILRALHPCRNHSERVSSYQDLRSRART